MTLVAILIGIFLFLGLILKFGVRFFRRFVDAVVRFLDGDYTSTGSARRTVQLLGDLLIIVVGIVVLWAIFTAIF